MRGYVVFGETTRGVLRPAIGRPALRGKLPSPWHSARLTDPEACALRAAGVDVVEDSIEDGLTWSRILIDFERALTSA